MSRAASKRALAQAKDFVASIRRSAAPRVVILRRFPGDAAEHARVIRDLRDQHGTAMPAVIEIRMRHVAAAPERSASSADDQIHRAGRIASRSDGEFPPRDPDREPMMATDGASPAGKDLLRAMRRRQAYEEGLRALVAKAHEVDRTREEARMNQLLLRGQVSRDVYERFASEAEGYRNIRLGNYDDPAAAVLIERVRREALAAVEALERAESELPHREGDE